MTKPKLVPTPRQDIEESKQVVIEVPKEELQIPQRI